MSDPLNLIYLSGVDYSASGFQNSAVRGIRRVRELLGSDNSFSAAHEAVQQFLANPTVKLLIETTTDAELAQKAIEEAAEYAAGAAYFEVNPDDLELPDPDGDPDGEDLVLEETPEAPEITPAAYRTAMALLAQTDGNPTTAYYMAAQLGRASGQTELFAQVIAAIVSVFPPLNSGITVIS